jgi:hypothetical protein
MEKIEKLIVAALLNINELKCESNISDVNGDKLIFPIKRDKSKRVSEQEAKQLFIRELEKQTDFLYSVETPTKEKYCFSGTRELSGNIDVCIYDESGKRKHLIEFKALNPGQESYSKDFEKLLIDNEEKTDNYFVQVIKNTNKGTIDKINKKYRNAYDYAITKAKNNIFSTINIILYEIEHDTLYKCKASSQSELVII